jgi:hypothetical protein
MESCETHFLMLEEVVAVLNTNDVLGLLNKDKISQHGRIQFVVPTDSGYSVKEIADSSVAESLIDFNAVMTVSRLSA